MKKIKTNKQKKESLEEAIQNLSQITNINTDPSDSQATTSEQTKETIKSDEDKQFINILSSSLKTIEQYIKVNTNQLTKPKNIKSSSRQSIDKINNIILLL